MAARKDLVDRISYLEVAYDYDWDAAKVFLEMREANPSSIVLKAVTEAKKRQAASKSGKEAPEKKRKGKADANNNTAAASGSGWRGYQQQYAGPQQNYWGQTAPTQPFYGYQSPYPPAAPYNRQATSFRPSTRPPGCFTCGEASHGFRRCPNASSAPPPPPPNNKPPPPT